MFYLISYGINHLWIVVVVFGQHPKRTWCVGFFLYCLVLDDKSRIIKKDISSSTLSIMPFIVFNFTLYSHELWNNFLHLLKKSILPLLLIFFLLQVHTSNVAVLQFDHIFCLYFNLNRFKIIIIIFKIRNYFTIWHLDSLSFPVLILSFIYVLL